jgi:hypothetical protein
MSANCPHCSQALGSGFVTQADLEERVKSAGKAAKDEAARLAGELAIAKVKAEGYDQALAGRTAAEQELGKTKTQFDRLSTLAASGIVQPAKVRGLSRAYEDYAAEAGDKAVDFKAWLAGPARTDEFLAPHFTGGATGAQHGAASGDAGQGKGALDQGAGAGKDAAQGSGGSQGQDAGKSAGKDMPRANSGAADPPAGQGVQTPAQLAAYFQSAEFKALPPKEREAKISELEKAVATKRPAV